MNWLASNYDPSRNSEGVKHISADYREGRILRRYAEFLLERRGISSAEAKRILDWIDDEIASQ